VRRAVACGFLVALGLTAGRLAAAAPERPEVSFEVFFQTLRPVGVWVELDDDLWAWRPVRVAKDWRPFVEGSWVLTEFGWYWLADAPWGWATSHYGRWEWREGRWVWLPDREWAPAWVAWREGEEAIGWHPLPARAEYDLEAGPIGAAEVGLRKEGWSFLLWSAAPAGLLPRPARLKEADRSGTLEGIRVSSTPLVVATDALLRQTKNITRIQRRDGVVHNPGPDRRTVEIKTGRKLAPCRLLDTQQKREVLLVLRDATILAAYRPIVRESRAEIHRWITRRAERYLKLEKRAGQER
jgi:hypothetical protein